jgi:hypothetical protein
MFVCYVCGQRTKLCLSGELVSEYAHIPCGQAVGFVDESLGQRSSFTIVESDEGVRLGQEVDIQ